MMWNRISTKRHEGGGVEDNKELLFSLHALSSSYSSNSSPPCDNLSSSLLSWTLTTKTRRQGEEEDNNDHSLPPCALTPQPCICISLLSLVWSSLPLATCSSPNVSYVYVGNYVRTYLRHFYHVCTICHNYAEHIIILYLVRGQPRNVFNTMNSYPIISKEYSGKLSRRFLILRGQISILLLCRLTHARWVVLTGPTRL